MEREIEIGRKLREARQNLGWTQTKAAEKSGILQPDISNYENARCVPKLHIIEKLAEAYFKPLSFFFSEE